MSNITYVKEKVNIEKLGLINSKTTMGTKTLIKVKKGIYVI